MIKKFIHNKEKVNIKSILPTLSIFILLSIVICLLIYLVMQISNVKKAEVTKAKEYNSYYMMITEDYNTSFWKEVYESAKEEGELYSAYVELFGTNLSVKYSKSELMKMAIAANPDGIILDADETEEIYTLINEAVDKGIPVITVLKDCAGSKRQSYVGVSNYELGREYGRCIVNMDVRGTKTVLILMNSNTEDNSRNILYSGITEILEKNESLAETDLKVKVVENDNVLGAQEVIRDIFLDEVNLPDIVVCLDERNTISAYQAAVDYNMVGRVNIIGYYVSETILNAISKQIINSTVTIDTKQTGTACINALNEYRSTGNVSGYVTMDVKSVTSNNVQEYINNVTKNQENEN